MGNIVSLFLFLSFALWEDYQTRKISNLLISAALICAILYQIRQNGFQGIIYSLFQVCTIFLILFPLYFFKGLGAGDIKLLGVTAVFLSWKLALFAFLTGIYLSLIPVLFLIIHKKKCLGSRVPMSGPIVGGILFILYKEGWI